ncbi:TonB C-terminal domain-containing protein [Campylobacter sp. faydin G-140]|uniref:TonB C-terminal domain-containing protein n=1 Tax=Campylobacter anatolicus TaxID=2829105 RepID=UPI001B9A516A|nr:TonB C-terminal domain-containing protein [Campylobacter anatolicus]MBR8461886.1 TonB C-terminal domain-containing protein [Campylobacter anatolicus]MBR8465023.1 TonB C-terminal domain-containing protein [Campylobacter anatolicus]
MPNNIKFPTISSFFVALSIYLLIISVVFLKLIFFTEPAKKYTDDKDAFMDIVVVESEVAESVKALEQKKEIVKENKPEPTKEQEEEKKETTNKPIVPDEPLPTPSIPIQSELAKVPPPTKEPAKEQPRPEPKKEEQPNIKDLFSAIDTSKLKKDSGITKTQPKEQSRKKSEESSSKSSKQASDIVKSLKLDSTAKAPKSQMTGTYNPLMGAIQKQIQRKWQSYRANSNNIAKIKAIIDMSGNFSYEILELSYDIEFNDKVKECLERLTAEKFPFSANENISLNVNLEDKLE